MNQTMFDRYTDAITAIFDLTIARGYLRRSELQLCADYLIEVERLVQQNPNGTVRQRQMARVEAIKAGMVRLHGIAI